MRVKNISNKVIGIPTEEGGCFALLPDSVKEVADKFSEEIEGLIALGLLEKTRAAVTKDELAEDSAAEEAASETAESKPKKTRAKRDAADI